MLATFATKDWFFSASLEWIFGAEGVILAGKEPALLVWACRFGATWDFLSLFLVFFLGGEAGKFGFLLEYKWCLRLSIYLFYCKKSALRQVEPLWSGWDSDANLRFLLLLRSLL